MPSRRNFIKQMGMLSLGALIPLPGMAKRRKTNKNIIKPPEGEWDVIVIGGGPAGCTAAISAAREGARTLLIESNGRLGGLGTSGMVPTWSPFSDGERMIYRGLAEKILNESKKAVPYVREKDVNWVPINPEYLTSVYDQMVIGSGAKVLFFSRICQVEMSADDTIDAVIVANKNGLTAFRAKVFIDATGDGDVAMWAGAKYSRGHDDKGTNQLSSLCFSMGGVDEKAFFKGTHIDTNGDRRSPLFEAAESGKYPLVDAYANCRITGHGQLSFNAGHINLDTTDPWQVSDAMIEGRKKAAEYLRALKDYRPDTFQEAFISRTAEVLGIRDSRRITGDYILTGSDWRERRQFDDEIGRNCYYIDIHGSKKPAERYKKGESHGIPYRCLTPRGLKNLLTAGRCISADGEVYGSTRIMPCCLVTGEAAGMAAKHTIDQSHGNVHSIDVDYLRKRLRQEGAFFL